MTQTQLVDLFSLTSINMNHARLLENLDIQTALEIARNADSEVDRTVWSYLETNVAGLWRRIQDQPNTYVMDKDEFALFNFFLQRYKDSELTEKAVDRFWRHQHQNATTDGR